MTKRMSWRVPVKSGVKDPGLKRQRGQKIASENQPRAIDDNATQMKLHKRSRVECKAATDILPFSYIVVAFSACCYFVVCSITSYFIFAISWNFLFSFAVWPWLPSFSFFFSSLHRSNYAHLHRLCTCGCDRFKRNLLITPALLSLCHMLSMEFAEAVSSSALTTIHSSRFQLRKSSFTCFQQT